MKGIQESRKRIENRQNLVLKMAAKNLAHEIKNPLFAIRLQTGILEKICGGNGKKEIGIINQEVDRLVSLADRVNKYLRESADSKAANE